MINLKFSLTMTVLRINRIYMIQQNTASDHSMTLLMNVDGFVSIYEKCIIWLPNFHWIQSKILNPNIFTSYAFQVNNSNNFYFYSQQELLYNLEYRFK